MFQPLSDRSKTLHKMVVTLLAMLLAGMHLEASAFGTLNDQSQNAVTRDFNRLDRNHDGKLARDEAIRDAEIAPTFGATDSNHDGSLTEDEYASVKYALQQARLEAYLEDSTVTAKIKTELLKDSGIKGLAISVETLHGKVILSGFVDNELQVRRAAEIASGVRGVTSVKNSLQLKGYNIPMKIKSSTTHIVKAHLEDDTHLSMTQISQKKFADGNLVKVFNCSFPAG